MKKAKTNVNLWVAIGAVILIILLIVWLTIADLWGDTDVAATILPLDFTPVHLINIL
ncbi:MAG: hypothetical protein NC043_07265 [Muribaculaceae bacterium]|nr:hypothetical protein [Muribaculaceae bacterium]